MSKLRAPYQCLKQCGNFLVAARGSSIDTFDLKDGSYLSTWKSPVPESTNGLNPSEAEAKSKTGEPKSDVSTPEIILDASTPPAKRRKLSGGSEEKEKTVVVQQGNKKAKGNAALKIVEPSPITALNITKDQQHVIAVTGEDKAIRVLEWDHSGRKVLKQISERGMPKRPCSVAITDDCSTIISADKFGDVYSLPLIPAPSVPENSASPSTIEKQAPKLFQPAASEHTVHSVRNRKALEAQKRQTNQVSEKTGPAFEHKLLLGHVSMLTDIAVADISGRQYIITADRDEHIRVSRGIPQTHIIEGFCLGHTEYVSRLCIPREKSNVLISGGGDDDLYVWDWVKGQLLFKVDLKSDVEEFSSNGVENTDIAEDKKQDAEPRKIAVTGIYHARAQPREEDYIIATCEGIPAAFIYILTDQNYLEHVQTLPLPGNALSVVLNNSTLESELSLIVSIDTVHKPGSTTVVRDSATDDHLLQCFKYEQGEFVRAQNTEFVSLDSEVFAEEGKMDKLSGLLYGVGNLRKMEGDEE